MKITEEQLKQLIREIIRKTKNKKEWCLYSKTAKTKSGKKRKLGCYSSRKGAANRERQVQYFKSRG